MHVIHHTHLDVEADDGERRLKAAGSACGIGGFEVWVHTLSPGTHTTPRTHTGELAALALSGSGKLLVEGGPQRFQAPCTLVVPARVEYQFVNNSPLPLQLVVVFTHVPVDAAPVSLPTADAGS